MHTLTEKIWFYSGVQYDAHPLDAMGPIRAILDRSRDAMGGCFEATPGTLVRYNRSKSFGTCWVFPSAVPAKTPKRTETRNLTAP